MRVVKFMAESALLALLSSLLINFSFLISLLSLLLWQLIQLTVTKWCRVLKALLAEFICLFVCLFALNLLQLGLI